MKHLIALITLFATTAMARPDTLDLTCNQVKSIVQRAGVVVMNIGPNVYDRFVANSTYCMYNQGTIAAYVATADKSYCYAGEVCTNTTGQARGSKVYSGKSYICEEGDINHVPSSNAGWNGKDRVEVQKCINGKYVTINPLP